MTTMKIALVLNTRHTETEYEVEYDPLHTIELIKHGIEATGHEYVFVEADENFAENIKKAKPDLVFNRAEGLQDKTQLYTRLKQMIQEYQQPILVEQFIEGREFSTGLLGRVGEDPEVLSILEIDFSKFPEVGGVYGQRAKTVLDSLDHYVCPAQIPEKLKNMLERLSVDIWYALEAKDFARIDFRMNSEGKLFFLEINPLPGLDFDTEENDLSFYPYMAMKSGYTYDELVRRLLESACSHYGLKLWKRFGTQVGS